MILRNKWLSVGALIALAAAIIVLGLFDPSTTPFPRCPFKMLTGFDCPGCGSQRAIHALIHGHLLQALRLNAFLICVALPYLLLIGLCNLTGSRHRSLGRALYHQWTILSFLFAALLWTLLRNL